MRFAGILTKPIFMPIAITQNGFSEILTTPGLDYIVAVTGDFGGGTVTMEWRDGEEWVSYGGIRITETDSRRVQALANHARIVLEGADDPEIEVSFLRAQDVNGFDESDFADVDEALAGVADDRLLSPALARKEIAANAFLRPDFLWKTMARLYTARQSRFNLQLRVVMIGDSFATCAEPFLRGAFGDVGEGFNLNSATYSGGASHTTGDFTKWISGHYVTLSSSGNVILGSGNTVGSRIKIYYLKYPGGGTFKVQTDVNSSGSWSDEAGYTAVSTNNPTNDAGVITIDKSDSNVYRVRIVWVSGTSYVIGGNLMEVDGQTGNRPGGAPLMDLSAGGSTPSQWAACPSVSLNTVLASFDPHLIFVKSDDPAEAYEASWPGLYEKLKIAAPNADFVIIGTHPTVSDPDRWIDSSGRDDYFRVWCAGNNALFVDIRHHLPEFNAETSAQGWWLENFPEGYHLSPIVGKVRQDAIINWQFKTLWASIFEDWAPKERTYQTGWIARYRNWLAGSICTSFTVANPFSQVPTYIHMASLGGSGAGHVNVSRARGLALLSENLNFVGRGLAVDNTDGNTNQLIDDSGRMWRGAFGFVSSVSVSRGVSASTECDAFAADRIALVAGGVAGQTANIFEVRTGTSLSSAGTVVAGYDKDGAPLAAKTLTASGTTGAQTINKACGRVNFAAAASSLVVTNSLVKARSSATVGSTVLLTVLGNDATMTSARYAISADGAFTIYPNAAPTGEVAVDFYVIN